MTARRRPLPALVCQAGLADARSTMNNQPGAIAGAERPIKQLQLCPPTDDRPPLERDCHRWTSCHVDTHREVEQSASVPAEQIGSSITNRLRVRSEAAA